METTISRDLRAQILRACENRDPHDTVRVGGQPICTAVDLLVLLTTDEDETTSCRWCGNDHTDTQCPRVSALSFGPDGQSVTHVAFCLEPTNRFLRVNRQDDAARGFSAKHTGEPD